VKKSHQSSFSTPLCGNRGVMQQQPQAPVCHLDFYLYLLNHLNFVLLSIRYPFFINSLLLGHTYHHLWNKRKNFILYVIKNEINETVGFCYVVSQPLVVKI